MRIIHRRCAGLDIHKKTISACIRIRVHGHEIETQEAVFGTFTQDLKRLRDWLKQYKVKQVGYGIHGRVVRCVNESTVV